MSFDKIGISVVVQPIFSGRRLVRVAILSTALGCAALPSLALGLEVGGIGVGVDLDVDHDGIDVGVDAGVGGLIDADVDVSLGGDGDGDGGGPGVGVDVVEDEDADAIRRRAGQLALACAGDGNASAFNGFVVRDRKGDMLGWVHDATLSPEDKLLILRFQSVDKTCYKLTGAGFKLRGDEVWTTLDAAAFR